MECNVEDKAAMQEEKKVDSLDQICCSSSADKAATFKSEALDGDVSWLEQPNKMFPPELIDAESEVSKATSSPLIVVDKSMYETAGTWLKPTSLPEMLGVLKEFGGVGEGGCKIVVGNTEVGIGTIMCSCLCSRENLTFR